MSGRTLVIYLDPDTIRECSDNPDLTDEQADILASYVEAEVQDFVQGLFDDK